MEVVFGLLKLFLSTLVDVEIGCHELMYVEFISSKILRTLKSVIILSEIL